MIRVGRYPSIYQLDNRWGVSINRWAVPIWSWVGVEEWKKISDIQGFKFPVFPDGDSISNADLKVMFDLILDNKDKEAGEYIISKKGQAGLHWQIAILNLKQIFTAYKLHGPFLEMNLLAQDLKGLIREITFLGEERLIVWTSRIRIRSWFLRRYCFVKNWIFYKLEKKGTV